MRNTSHPKASECISSPILRLAGELAKLDEVRFSCSTWWSDSAELVDLLHHIFLDVYETDLCVAL